MSPPQGFLLCSYDTVLNGFAARLTPSAAQRLRQHPLVAQVLPNGWLHPDLTRVSGFLSISSGLWSQIRGKQSRAGAGVVVGVVDSGVWPENPFFNDVSGRTSGPTWILETSAYW